MTVAAIRRIVERLKAAGAVPVRDVTVIIVAKLGLPAPEAK